MGLVTSHFFMETHNSKMDYGDASGDTVPCYAALRYKMDLQLSTCNFSKSINYFKDDFLGLKTAYGEMIQKWLKSTEVAESNEHIGLQELG